MLRSHCANTVVMVRPVDFGWNEQTARDNEFQQKPDSNAAQTLRALALLEFDRMVDTLRAHGVNVLILEKGAGDPPLPDAVFPNNWFSSWPDLPQIKSNTLFTYPMRTQNRQAEVRTDALLTLLVNNGFSLPGIQKISAAPGQALEGTGALVFDHLNRVVYAAVSDRCDALLATEHAHQLGYEVTLFASLSSHKRPFYHTNVLLSIGEDFALICAEALPNIQEREHVLARLRASKRDVICLSLAQTEQYFCANVLQLATRSQQRVIAMSQSAYEGLQAKQRQVFEQHGEILAFAIPTIEKIGGGSVRCMLAEIFLN